MKTTIRLFALSLLAAAVTGQGCDDDSYKYYTREKCTLHFDLPERQQDSVVYSFIKYTDGTGIEVKLPLEIAGYASERDRYYRLRVVADSSTAREGVHYEPLEERYAFRANRYHDSARIVFYNTDEELTRSTRRLYVEIEATDDFATGIWYKQRADIRFANIVRKPLIWDDENGMDFYNTHCLAFYFGDYSKVKHVCILQQTGLDEFPDVWPGDATATATLIATFTHYGLIMNKYFTDNVVYDENGDRIEPLNR
jgi:hypothetical protein